MTWARRPPGTGRWRRSAITGRVSLVRDRSPSSTLGMLRPIREAMRMEPRHAHARTAARWVGAGRDERGDAAAAAAAACDGRDAALLVVFAPARRDLGE